MRGTSERRCSSAWGGQAGKEKREKKTARLEQSARGRSDHSRSYHFRDCQRLFFFELPPSQCCKLCGNVGKTRVNIMITVISHSFCLFRVAPFCDSSESCASGWNPHQRCLDHDRLKQCYVKAKNQRHATITMQIICCNTNASNMYVNVTEQ